MAARTITIATCGGGGTYFDGGMCGVAVFNKALSTADHEAIAAAAGL